MVQNYAHAMCAVFGAGEFAADFVRPLVFGKTQPSQHRHCQSNFCLMSLNITLTNPFSGLVITGEFVL